jgi:hypothetical protein
MKRLLTVCVALSLLGAFAGGCDNKSKTERTDTVTTPGGQTTTTDTHKVESSGDNPPANASGEVAK